MATGQVRSMGHDIAAASVTRRGSPAPWSIVLCSLLLLAMAWIPAGRALADHIDLERAALTLEDLPEGYAPFEVDRPSNGIASDPVHVAFFVAEPIEGAQTPFVIGVATAEVGVSGERGADRERLLAHLLVSFPRQLVHLGIADPVPGPPVARQTGWVEGTSSGSPASLVYLVAFVSGEGVGALMTVGLSQDEAAGLAGIVAERLALLSAPD